MELNRDGGIKSNSPGVGKAVAWISYEGLKFGGTPDAHACVDMWRILGHSFRQMLEGLEKLGKRVA
jgi:hypothetical protein